MRQTSIFPLNQHAKGNKVNLWIDPYLCIIDLVGFIEFISVVPKYLSLKGFEYIASSLKDQDAPARYTRCLQQKTIVL